MVRHESDVHGFITRTFFKIGPPGRVGIESEWFVLDPELPHQPVPIERLQFLLTAAGPRATRCWPMGSSTGW
jgi:glutamate--cysteine ligase